MYLPYTKCKPRIINPKPYTIPISNLEYIFSCKN